MKCFAAVLTVLVAAASACAQPTGLGDETSLAVSMAIQRSQDALGNSQTRDDACKAISAIHNAYLQTLSDCIDDTDPEVATRAAEALSAAMLEARVARVLVRLPQEQQDKLLVLRRIDRDLFDNVFSEDVARRVAAVKKLADHGDDEALAEPLLVLCVQHPSPQLRAAAAEAVLRLGVYKSTAMVEALTGVITRVDGPGSRYQYHYSSDESPYPSAVAALGKIGTPAAAKTLVQALQSGSSYDYDVPIVNAIVACGDLSAIPSLMPLLKQTHANRSWGMGDGVTITGARCDAPLLALVRLTNQSESDYKFVSSPAHYYRNIVGFADKAHRTQAIDRFRQWWDQHKDQPPYCDLKPFSHDLDTSQPYPTSGPRPVQEVSVPAATTQASQPESHNGEPKFAAAMDARELADRVRTRTRELIEMFRSDQFRVRRMAQQQLAAMHERMLDAIRLTANDDNASAVLDLLADMIAECSYQQALASLQPAARARLRQFRLRHEDKVKQTFSLQAAKAEEALISLVNLPDVEALAEPLIIIHLRHSNSAVVDAAAALAATGRYKSDDLVDLLGEMALSPSDSSGMYSHRGPSGIQSNALMAMTSIRSPRCTAVYLAMLKRYTGNSEYQPRLVDAIVASGELRAIPVLLQDIQGEPNDQGSWSTNNFTMTLSPMDAPLMALVKLTGQRPEEYGFVFWPHDRNDSRPFGFKEKDDRKKALTKFRQWWQQHKEDPKYKDLEPMELPSLPGHPPSHSQNDAWRN